VLEGIRSALALGILAWGVVITSVARTAPTWQAIRRSDLIVTSGTIGGDSELRLRDPTIRATVGVAPRSGIEAKVTYLAPSAVSAPLASGELRRQFGFKLRAKDGCNVVYAMWHIEPDAGIHVSVKTNPDAGTDCGDRGYENVTASSARSDLPPLAVNQKRTLTARIVGSELQVDVDGAAAWRGTLPAQAFAFDGPVGIRSDNGQFNVSLRVTPSGS
jgi:hypothetical protein